MPPFALVPGVGAAMSTAPGNAATSAPVAVGVTPPGESPPRPVVFANVLDERVNNINKNIQHIEKTIKKLPEDTCPPCAGEAIDVGAATSAAPAASSTDAGHARQIWHTDPGLEAATVVPATVVVPESTGGKGLPPEATRPVPPPAIAAGLVPVDVGDGGWALGRSAEWRAARAPDGGAGSLQPWRPDDALPETAESGVATGVPPVKNDEASTGPVGGPPVVLAPPDLSSREAGVAIAAGEPIATGNVNADGVAVEPASGPERAGGKSGIPGAAVAGLAVSSSPTPRADTVAEPDAVPSSGLRAAPVESKRPAAVPAAAVATARPEAAPASSGRDQDIQTGTASAGRAVAEDLRAPVADPRASGPVSRAANPSLTPDTSGSGDGSLLAPARPTDADLPPGAPALAQARIHPGSAVRAENSPQRQSTGAGSRIVSALQAEVEPVSGAAISALKPGLARQAPTAAAPVSSAPAVAVAHPAGVQRRVQPEPLGTGRVRDTNREDAFVSRVDPAAAAPSVPPAPVAASTGHAQRVAVDPSAGGPVPGLVSAGVAAGLRVLEPGVQQTGDRALPKAGGLERESVASEVRATSGAMSPISMPQSQPAARPEQPFAAPGLPVGPGLGEELGHRILWLSGNRLRGAEIYLDPPELGPLQVQIHAHRDGTSLQLLTHTTSARDAVESALPRLREMLESSGLNLLDVNVAQQQQQNRNAARDGQDAAFTTGAGARLREVEESVSADPARARVPRGLVDDYA